MTKVNLWFKGHLKFFIFQERSFKKRGRRATSCRATQRSFGLSARRKSLSTSDLPSFVGMLPVIPKLQTIEERGGCGNIRTRNVSGQQEELDNVESKRGQHLNVLPFNSGRKIEIES